MSPAALCTREWQSWSRAPFEEGHANTGPATTSEHSIGVDERAGANEDRSIEVDDIEGAILPEVAVDLTSTDIGPVSPVTTSGVGNPTASGAGCPWHCGCRDPSPSLDIMVASDTAVLRLVLVPVRHLWPTRTSAKAVLVDLLGLLDGEGSTCTQSGAKDRPVGRPVTLPEAMVATLCICADVGTDKAPQCPAGTTDRLSDPGQRCSKRVAHDSPQGGLLAEPSFCSTIAGSLARLAFASPLKRIFIPPDMPSPAAWALLLLRSAVVVVVVVDVVVVVGDRWWSLVVGRWWSLVVGR